MHKGIILIVKASDRDEAQSEAEDFLIPYEDQVLDWWQIGGRWTGILDGYDPEKDPINIETCPQCNGTGKRDDLIGRRMKEDNPDFTCNSCKGEGKRVKWPTQWEEHKGDILPLDKVKKNVLEEWKQNPKTAGDKLRQDFNSNCNIFNVETDDYNLPDEKDWKDNWWAIIIDIHH